MKEKLVCVDASLAVKWVLQDGYDVKGNMEERCDLARQWLVETRNDGVTIISPTILDSEVRHNFSV